jgi:transcriptional regulator with XRE-family HTH domain
MGVKGVPLIRKPLRLSQHQEAMRWRAQGCDVDEIAERMGVTDSEVRRFLDSAAQRYEKVIARGGKTYVLIEQAMAMETSMRALSTIRKSRRTPANVRVQAIQLMEAIRKDWLKVMAQVGVAETVGDETFFDKQIEGLTDEQKSRLIRLAVKRLAKAQRRQEGEKADGGVRGQGVEGVSREDRVEVAH